MHKGFIKKAVTLSKKSFEQGKFPAGAVIAKGDKVVGTATSSAYLQQHLHAETKLIDQTVAGNHNFDEVVNNLNRKIEFIQDKTHFNEALDIFKKWEEKVK